MSQSKLSSTNWKTIGFMALGLVGLAQIYIQNKDRKK
jgi:hypothetical protein